MARDKLERLNDLLDDLNSEARNPVWSEDQKNGIVQAQRILSDVKESAQRTDFEYTPKF